jgi:hypothetical protein
VPLAGGRFASVPITPGFFGPKGLVRGRSVPALPEQHLPKKEALLRHPQAQPHADTHKTWNRATTLCQVHRPVARYVQHRSKPLVRHAERAMDRFASKREPRSPSKAAIKLPTRRLPQQQVQRPASAAIPGDVPMLRL